MERNDSAADIQRLLGTPTRRSMSHSSGSDITFRSMWACGCELDRLGEENVVMNWARCVIHERVVSAGASCAGSVR